MSIFEIGTREFHGGGSFALWISVTCVALALMIVVGVLAGNVYYDVIKNVLGREIAQYGEGSEPLYVAETNSKEAALEHANATNEKVCEEGFVLLKNEEHALPLQEGAKISVFGKNSVNLVYGGSGSSGGNEKGRVSLYASLREAGFLVNEQFEAFYNDAKRSGPARPENSSDLDSGADVDISTGETPYIKYDSAALNSYEDYPDAALVVLSRIGGEGFDLPRQSVDNAKRHYLELDPNEADLIRNVTTSGFKKVVVLINSAAVMELDWVESGLYGEVDACLWIGAPGNTGINALGRVLNGKANPSGKTVDTWAADLLASPAVVNFGSNGEYEGDAYLVPDEDGNVVTDAQGRPVADGYFVSYEEGIYIGYRYYETRGETDGEDWYRKNVVYPFGYGRSYTTFETKIANREALGTKLNAKEEISLTLNVKNTGSEDGKEVVQVYVTAPYYEGGVEKAHKVLCGFAKTKLLERGETAEVPIEIDPYSFASYDYAGKADPAYKGYLLEHGTYVFSVGKNAHETIDAFTLTLDEDVRFEEDSATKNPVVNRFDDAAAELNSVLSRADWEGTWPEKPTYEARLKSEEFIDDVNSRKHNNPNEYTAMSKTNQPVTITAFDFVREEDYKGYNDPRWEQVLDALTVDEMANLCGRGEFNTQAITKIGKNATTDADGCAGFTIFMDDPTVYGTCAYASEVVMASTWNVDLIFELGESVGEEGLWGNVRGDGAPYSGWYAPGGNLHRTPFGGRNFEYYSEDGFLSGMMAAHQIKGAASKGVYCYMKHFVANDQETHRSLTGLCTWLNEQSLREFYFKPFEIAVKEGKAKGIMSSFNRLGTKLTGGDYRLLTEVLRGEWGFEGTVICDFNSVEGSYMNAKQMIYAGGDLNLSNLDGVRWSGYKADSAADVTVLRKAAKNIIYTVSSSNAMNAKAEGYLPPVWFIVMVCVMVAVSAGIVVWGGLIVWKTLKGARCSEGEPEETPTQPQA